MVKSSSRLSRIIAAFGALRYPAATIRAYLVAQGEEIGKSDSFIGYHCRAHGVSIREARGSMDAIESDAAAAGSHARRIKLSEQKDAQPRLRRVG
jgi:hypothetical protein